MVPTDTSDLRNGAVPAVTTSIEIPQISETHVEEYLEAADPKDLVPINCDVLIVGAGFSGIAAIHSLRKKGFNVKCFEAGDNFGGVWYWNRYPGARVDSEAPYYQLNIPEVYRDWNFTQRFPDHAELRRYMEHADKVLNLRKETIFNARVNSCHWSETDAQWTIKTVQGHIAHARHLLLCSGLVHVTYTPAFPGLDVYKGTIMHSSAWPKDFDATGKKIGLIGAGATAVQITQELGKTAEELTVMLRRPSYCLPMGQRSISLEENLQQKIYYPWMFASGRKSGAGFPVIPNPKATTDASEAEREELWQRSFRYGGFCPILTAYSDFATNPESNLQFYHFWRRQVLDRMTDAKKAAIMAPEKPPYYYGTKRQPLEQDYYEVLDRPNVHVHSLAAAPLETFTSTGIRTADGKHHEFDAIVLATGFDTLTGSVTSMGLHDRNGTNVKETWAERGVLTYRGFTIPEVPNCWMVYSPHSPAAVSNGPTLAEAQLDVATDFMVHMRETGTRSVVATEAAAQEFVDEIDAVAKRTLFPLTDSWWNGTNIPGKKKQNMTYLGGLQAYEALMRDGMEEFKGFDIVKG